jgi:hypothetical protein
MAELFIAHRDVVWRLAAEKGPALFAVSRGAVRQIDLTD